MAFVALASESRFKDYPGGTAKLNDGNEIPMIGLGTAECTGQETIDVMVEAALAAGYRLFDTARWYKNETELGNALEKFMPKYGVKREDIWLTTKVSIVDANPEGECRRMVMESCMMLKTDYLDMVLVHYPRDRYTGKDRDHEVNFKSRKEVWVTLEALKAEGKIRTIGVSNYYNYHLTEMEKYAKIPPAVNQIEFHPYLTQNLIRLQCKQQGIFVQSFSNLCWGNDEVVSERFVLACAQKYNTSPQAILYAFALSAGCGIIPRSIHSDRITTNLLELPKLKLTCEEMEDLLDLDRNKGFCPGCEAWKCM